MKKLNNLSESDFLKIFFGFFTAAALIAAVCMPDRSTMLSGLYNIVSQPSKISTNYFSLGGYAACFLNVGLVSLIYLAMYELAGTQVNNVSALAFLLNFGFAFWGINVLNLWSTALGVGLYCLVKKEAPGKNINAVLFSAGLAPLITELMIRYPSTEVIGFNARGIILSLLVGIVIGFVLPMGMAHSSRVHKGFDLYSAALPMGMAGMLLQAFLYKTPGIELAAAPAASTLTVASQSICNIFCCILFCCCILVSVLMGCRVEHYKVVLADRTIGTSISTVYGNAAFLMNVGVYGLFILLYYNIIGATFNSLTLGVIFCMLACCDSGSNPLSVWPIVAGYIVGSFCLMGFSHLLGGSFGMTLTSQAIVGGVCYANGLSPITRKYGWTWGLAAGLLHYILVTTIPNVHGGFLLHNGGFTAAMVCIVLIPIMETFAKKQIQPQCEEK